MHSIDTYLIDNLPIQINGNEKYATGLTKRTTIDDVKYAILSCTLNKNETINLNDYAIFERWQGNERILDGKLKIYKLIRLWKSLPGNQLDNVKFIIKKRKNIHLQTQQQHVQQQQQQMSCNKHNTASPTMNKAWNSNKAANALRKSTRVHSRSRNNESPSSSRDSSTESIISSASSNDDNKFSNRYDQRYSSIRKFNRSKKSTICKNEDRREAFLSLVNKQNDIIEKQQQKIESSDKLIKKCVTNCLKGIRSVSSRSKSLDKYDEQNNQQPADTAVTSKNQKRQASKSRERSSSIRRLVVKDANMDDIEIPEMLKVTSNDIKQTFENILDEKQLQEYASLCNNYFKIQKNIKINKNQIEKLNTELNTIKQTNVQHPQQQLSKETHHKIQNSLQTYDKQNEKLLHLNDALNRIDEIILLKSNLIKSLETELKKIEDEQLFDLKNGSPIQNLTTTGNNNKKLTTSTSTSSTISSFSSSSSILTSVSEQGVNTNNMTNKSTKLHFGGDNDSDTGISSANSDDFTPQLETLV